MIEQITPSNKGEKVISHSQCLIKHRSSSKPQLSTSLDDIQLLINELRKVKLDKEYAEKTARLTEILSGSLAHELRTPLSTINLYADIIEGDLNSVLETKVDILKVLEKIKKTVKDANYLINNVLGQIKNKADGGKKSQQDFKLDAISRVIEETIANYPFQFEERQIIEFKNDFGFEYFGDNVLTKHVLFNLIKNSLRAISNAGKGKITIKLEIGDIVNKLIFTDTADGVPKEFLPKMFDQFASLDKQNGTGIGLAFCKTVMQSYNGDIVCNSKKGEYTEFTLTFPKVRAVA